MYRLTTAIMHSNMVALRATQRLFLLTICKAATSAMWLLAVLPGITLAEHDNEGCDWGIYGENCDRTCPSNCAIVPPRNLRHCLKHTGKCSEGCVRGYHGDHCNIFCSGGCLNETCNNGDGHCTLGCKETYIGDFCNETSGILAVPSTVTTTAGPDDNNLAAILVPVFLIILIVCIILAVVVFRLRSRRRAESKRRYPNNEYSTPEAAPLKPHDTVPLIEKQPEAVQPEADPSESPGNEDTHKIVPDTDKQLTDQPSREKDISDLFVETEGYREVKDKLETLGHVTITGAPGAGKTSMALMLGAEFRRQGYELVLVEDVGTFQLSDILSKDKDICVIFDDIFQNVGPSMDVHRLRQVLYELHGHLEPWKTKLERRYNILQQTPGTEQRRKDRLNLYFIFTTDSNNLEQARPKLKEPILFQNSSVVDLTNWKTGEEKKAIWLKHKDHSDCKTEVNVNIIIAYENRTGFPLACKLFSRYAPFQKHKESFLEMPEFHLKQELHKNINHLDDLSVKLLLRSLCGGEQNTRTHHTGSDNKVQDTHLKDVLDLVSCSHPLIQDMCMSAILDTKPELFLHNCSLKFICDHVRDQQHDTAPAEQTVIYFPGAHSDAITTRLAEAVADGTFTNYIKHPIWKRKEVADKVHQMFPYDGTKSHETKHCILHYACFLGNNDIIDRLLHHCDVNRRAVNGWTPVMFAVAGGQMDSLKILVVHKADIRLCDAMNNNLFHLACQYGSISLLQYVEKKLKKSNTCHINSRGVNGWTPIMHATVAGKNDIFDYLVKQGKRDLTLRDSNNNTVLHLACMYANKTIVNSLLPSTDKYCQGNNGMTPVMCALLSGRMDVFDLLVSQNADTALTDDNNNSLLHLACLLDDIPDILLTKIDADIQGNHGWTPLMKAAINGSKHAFDQLDKAKTNLYLKDDYNNNILHLACHGGHVSIVKHLLTVFGIDTRGNKGWTPVMYAAASGAKDVFDLLVSQGADVSLKDDYNNSVFHLACVGGSLSIVKCLLPKSKVNSSDYLGRTAIMKAAESGHIRVFDFLVSQKVDLELTDHFNNTVLHFACEGGNVAILEHLLTTADLNARGTNGWSPVIVAARFGKSDVFNLLVSKEVDLTLKDDHGNNMLHLACQGGNMSITEHLLPLFDINSRGQDGRTPVMYAAENGVKSVFDLLVSKGADTSLKDDHNNSVFHLACFGGNKSIVEQLHPNVDINSLADSGRTAIMKAASARNKNVFNFLVSENADLKVIDDYRDSVLHLACKGGETTIVQCVLQKLDINTRGKKGLTPAMIAASLGNRHLFNVLVSQQADLTLTDDHGNNMLHLACQGGNRSIIVHLFPGGIHTRGQDGRTAVMYAALNGVKNVFDLVSTLTDMSLKDDYNSPIFHLACRGGNTSIVEYLLQQSDINHRGFNNRTALMEAALAGKTNVFRLLVSKDAELNLTDDYNDNVLHFACLGGDTVIVRNLLKVLDINAKGRNGCTPVMHAAWAGQRDVFSLLVSQSVEMELLDLSRNNLLHLACQGGNTSIIKYLLPLFDINSPGEDGWTPIMMAALSGKMEAYDLIVTTGGIPSLTTPQNDNVLHAACQGGNKAIVRKVIGSFGINTRGKNGCTPLMRAVVGGHMSMMKFLMSRNADHTLVDKDGLTLLHLACKFGHLDIVKHISDKFNIDTQDKGGLTCIVTSVLHGKVAVFDYLRSRGAILTLVDSTGDDALNIAYKVNCRQIIETLISGGASERNVKPLDHLVRSILRSDVYNLNMYKPDTA
ncbi:serine/threonine-protein phosphatase 6 regulatory ankyrin repeat subunit B-like isoform X2 [Haliotis rubra]|uniref:serine/threonine-protein phosphatase 6 regulatory ankyrin repeat subunit B-like isoform X2 n=2 Tax=Haliotis rubra TaxID=36100 RepID=UPI001EE5A24D|nr:serine/threonine-protein phosphatase 6 regulatory ankyrin repeat subunit B-like isoform X2 [Haliotis rubra]